MDGAGHHLWFDGGDTVKFRDAVDDFLCAGGKSIPGTSSFTVRESKSTEPGALVLIRCLDDPEGQAPSVGVYQIRLGVGGRKGSGPGVVNHVSLGQLCLGTAEPVGERRAGNVEFLGEFVGLDLPESLVVTVLDGSPNSSILFRRQREGTVVRCGVARVADSNERDAVVSSISSSMALRKA